LSRFHSIDAATNHMNTMANEIKQPGHLNFPLPGKLKTNPASPKSNPTP
jgi:hypothetical protein